MEIPNSYNWFVKLKLTKFIPWHFDEVLNSNSIGNERFKIENNSNREVLTFGNRQDMDTFVGFEIKNGKVCENVIVFHPSFQKNTSDWAPQVAYREAIRKSVEVEGKFVKQSGGKGQFGRVMLKIEPNEAGKGFEFVDAIKGGAVPREFIPAVEKGLRETLPNGVLAGFPVVDVKVTLFDGSYHEVDSNENAFKMAASMGFKDGMRKADPVLLEPMMSVEVETPEDYAGTVMGDLSSRRGMVQGMDDMMGGGKSIKAEVPLAEMFGYSTSLRSATQGRATYTMEFKHYAEAPRNVAEAIMNKK